MRMQAGPGARSRVTSVRSGPQSGCQTNFQGSGRDCQPRLGAFRSKRVTIGQGDDLSFIGEGGGFEVSRTEDGN